MKGDLDAATARLDEYARGKLADAAASEYEQDLFARALDGAAPELVFRDQLQRTLREMKERGTIDPWITARDLERLRGSGLRVEFFELDLAQPSMPDLSRDFDVLVTRIALDLSGVQRLDAEVLTPAGQLVKMMPDISFDPADGAVYACCEAELARSAASATTLTRVWAIGDSGRKLLLELAV